MLDIVISKILLKTAVKTLIVKPVITATVSIIPSASLFKASIFGFEVIITTKEVLSLGAESIAECYIDKKLDFRIDKIAEQKFSIEPLNDIAKLYFMQSSYSSYNQLIIDLNEFENKLDELNEYRNKEINNVEKLLDKKYNELIDDVEIGEEIDKLLKEEEEILNKVDRELDHEFNTLYNQIDSTENILDKSVNQELKKIENIDSSGKKKIES